MWNDVDKRIQRAMGGIRQAFRGVVSRVNSTPAVQLVQTEGLADEELPDVELFQEYGFTSNPPAGTMTVVLPVGGRTSHGIVVATEHGSYRLKSLAPGEVALYTDEGAKIVLKRNRVIETDCSIYRINCEQYEVNASGGAKFETPMVTASAQMTAEGQINGNGGLAVQGGAGARVTGSIRATEDVTAGQISLQDHDHTDSIGGTTSPAQ